MQENSLVAVRDAEILAHLVRGPTLDIAECDHCFLHSWQCFDRFEQRRAQLARQHALLGKIVPWRHGARPHAGPPSFLEEPVATHAEVVSGRLVGCELGKRYEPLLLLCAPSRTVAEDRVDPRPERRSPLESVEAADDVQPRLLNHLVGYRTARDERHRNPRHRGRVTANKRTEGLLVSVPQLGEDVLLRALGRDGARPDHGPTVARNTRAGRVSTVCMPASTRDDHALLAACADGDGQALATLYDRFGTVAFRLAVRVLRDPALAEDAVQEAFLAVWRQAAKFDPSRGRASTWILTLVHRRAVDLVRKQASFNALSDQLEMIGPGAFVAESADNDVGLREMQGEVQAALGRLSKAEREVLGLAYWGGLTQSEIATVLGIPTGTVKSRTFSALARLREALAYEVATSAS